jgi:hypothetical protein
MPIQYQTQVGQDWQLVKPRMLNSAVVFRLLRYHDVLNLIGVYFSFLVFTFPSMSRSSHSFQSSSLCCGHLLYWVVSTNGVIPSAPSMSSITTPLMPPSSVIVSSTNVVSFCTTCGRERVRFRLSSFFILTCFMHGNMIISLMSFSFKSLLLEPAPLLIFLPNYCDIPNQLHAIITIISSHVASNCNPYKITLS